MSNQVRMNECLDEITRMNEDEYHEEFVKVKELIRLKEEALEISRGVDISPCPTKSEN